MEVDETQMRRVAAKVRTIGNDAQAALDKEKPALDFGSQGNEGFAAMAALKSAVDKLHHAASRLAQDSRTTGESINRAADNHRANEQAQRDNFANGLRELTTFQAP